MLVSQTLPQVYDIAHVCHRDDTLLGHSLKNGRDELVKVFMKLVDPSLIEALLCCQGVDFGRHAYYTCNVASFRLSTAHAAKTSCDEEFHVVATHFPCGVEHSDSGAVDNALRTDIHIAASGHLSVL